MRNLGAVTGPSLAGPITLCCLTTNASQNPRLTRLSMRLIPDKKCKRYSRKTQRKK
jgi:hypothetical protein